nr:immunoglobulin heavy chain junction region [Mus musculus]NSM04001.1 immunoglobulin heavy chain junction region [Mus musculus]NSM04093.1 immunoglobulin heavy chain junction region [Mus musculus]NSM04113.1 immunoglobulin heavy chain junction region [Mus musculus]NSM04286.1 immunoglobulin heavy chain junction region [Mus musculus]
CARSDYSNYGYFDYW